MNAVTLIALLAVAGQPAAFLHEREDELLAFSYGWPAVVEAEPALREILAGEMETAEARARTTAAEDRGRRGESGFPFQRHSYHKIWSVEGSTPQLLSLSAGPKTYTGGAHGSRTFAVVLWDRAADRKVGAAALLGEAALARLTPRLCDALNAERSERRGEPVTPDPSDAFTACPALADLPLAPADADGDGRFDTLQVLIAPYQAGPWVEGPYPIAIRFEAENLAGIAAAWRPAFEPSNAAPPMSESGGRG